MKPIRIQLKRRKGWGMPPNTVKVDRGTRWGNPFIVGRHGSREDCVDLYRKLLAGYLCISINNVDEQQRCRQAVIDHLEDLRGKNLACWCPLDKPCHADTLLAIANPEQQEDP